MFINDVYYYILILVLILQIFWQVLSVSRAIKYCYYNVNLKQLACS